MLADLVIRALNRRWRLALVTLVSGLVVTVLLHPQWGVHDYEATHVLYSPAAGRAGPNGPLVDPFMLKPEAVAALATSRQNALAAATLLGYDGNPGRLLEHLTARADNKAGTVSITDRRTNPKNAAAVANAMAESLVRLVDASRADARAKAIDEAQARVDELDRQLAGLDSKDPTTKSRRDQLTQERSATAAQLDTLQHAGDTSGLASIRPAVARRVATGSLRSLPPIVGWLLTLLPLAALGLAVAVAAEFADDTVADGASADAATGLPVVAEVPRDEADVVAAVADLREVILNGAGSGRPPPSFAVPAVRGRGCVVVVTSPSAAEATTDAVVQLASSVADAGRSALIVDCDDTEESDSGDNAGLAGLASSGIIPQSLERVVQPTSLPRVAMVPRGEGDGTAAWLLHHRHLIDSSRSLADVVVLHAPPVLGGDDATQLAKLADLTLVVCRAQSTKTADARRAGERLRAASIDAGVMVVDVPPPAPPVPSAKELVERVRTDPRTRGRVEWAGAGVAMLLLFVLLRSFVFESFSIPTPSMVPYLKPGDRVLVSRLSYHLHAVHRGDVIVFDAPKTATALQGERLIKRVIALPGETVESRDGHIFINNKQLPENYLPKSTVTTGVKKLTLPAGRYWVMGDNRPNSADSRFFGSITRGSIIGRAFFHIWPWPIGLM